MQGFTQGGLALAGSDKHNILDPTLLKCLAMTAAAHERTLEEELNCAVKTYILQEFTEHGVDQLAERTLSDLPTAAAK